MKERRLITFAVLRKYCGHRYANSCGLQPTPFDMGKCSYKSCPIWKRLHKPMNIEGFKP